MTIHPAIEPNLEDRNTSRTSASPTISSFTSGDNIPLKASLTSLIELDLTSTQITDEGLKELSGLVSLRKLNLGLTQLTDKGLKDLPSKKSLRKLYLWETAVTDKGLSALSEFEVLSFLDVRSTKVTDKGVRKFNKTFPRCKVNVQ